MSWIRRTLGLLPCENVCPYGHVWLTPVAATPKLRPFQNYGADFGRPTCGRNWRQNEQERMAGPWHTQGVAAIQTAPKMQCRWCGEVRLRSKRAHIWPPVNLELVFGCNQITAQLIRPCTHPLYKLEFRNNVFLSCVMLLSCKKLDLLLIGRRIEHSMPFGNYICPARSVLPAIYLAFAMLPPMWFC
jgi:hypothetical protein